MATKQLYEDRHTLEALAEGDEAAFVRIFDLYSPRVYRVALRFLNSKESAEEVVQEVFMDIWLRREKMSGVANVAAYIQGMARKQVFDAYRRQSAFTDVVQELGFFEQSDHSTDRLLQEQEYEMLLRQAIGKLSPLQQEIFRLAREEGMTHEEIGRELSLTRLSVKSHMKRILAFIRIQLAPFLNIHPLFWPLIFLPD